ncbi:hypothetical protein NMY22_g7089 [Coprinellus aureogranulatus]|nr:hypothetical protein NMY22_g7089 [Coprinellus aureogranulatus]
MTIRRGIACLPSHKQGDGIVDPRLASGECQEVHGDSPHGQGQVTTCVTGSATISDARGSSGNRPRNSGIIRRKDLERVRVARICIDCVDDDFASVGKKRLNEHRIQLPSCPRIRDEAQRQIQMSTSPCELGFIWANSDPMPIELDFCVIDDNQTSLPRTFTVISKILRDEFDRVKSIRFCCDLSVLKAILAKATGEASLPEVAGSYPRAFPEVAPGMDKLFDFLRVARQLEILELGELPWGGGDESAISAYPLIHMPKLKRLTLLAAKWRPICAVLAVVRMPLSGAQEKQVSTYCGSRLVNNSGDLRGAYTSSLVAFFGGSISPEEVEIYPEEDSGWNVVKAWTRHRIQWPDSYNAAGSGSIKGRTTITFENRQEWINSIYEDIGLATSGEADVEENVGRILQAFTKQGRRRTVDELKLVFHAQLELRDTALLRGVLRRLQEAAIATRIGVWDIDGELKHNNEDRPAEDKALKMNERRMAQRDLEARIQELELELCRLKRIRNALLPISQLPPELLCEILSFDALTLANDDCESPPPNPVPNILNFCHVSHLWRTIIFGSPKMWSYIRVGMGTTPELIHFMWKNTGLALVDMNIDSSKGEDDSLGTPIAIDVVVGIIRQHPTRFHSLRVRLELDSVRAIFEGFQGSFDNLEDLLVSDPKGDWGKSNSSGIGQYLVCRTPKLRRFWSTGYTLPFDCPLVSSPSLRNVRVFQDGGNMNDLLSFFRRCSRSIRSVEAGVNFAPSSGGASGNLSTPENLLEFPYLKEFHFQSANWRTLVKILYTIRISSPAFSFSCGEVPDENLHELFSAVAHANGGILSPKEVRLRTNKVVTFWRKPLTHPLVDGTRRMLPAGVHSQLVLPQTYIETKGTIPFADPLHYQTGWSFANLRVLTTATHVPRGIWTVLAHSTPLEVLRVGPCVDCYDVFDALRGLGTASGSIPFPRLQVIVNTYGLPWNYDDPGRRQASGFSLPIYTEDFPFDLAAALVARRGDDGQSGRLALLDFQEISLKEV